MGSRGTDRGFALRPWSGAFGARARAHAARFAPLGVVALGLLGLILIGDGLSWLAGLLAGAAAGAWLASGRAGRGPGPDVSSEGRAERRTQDAVASLERSGWHFLHDVRGSDSAYDHIAVGPGGVILLESLDPEGLVTMQAGRPIVERRRDPGAKPQLERLHPHALADASAFRDDILRVAHRRLWVQAVVVFWSDFPAGCVADGRCVYVHGSRLAEWIARRPLQLDDADAEDVFEAVQQLARAGGDVVLRVAV
jgi:Nuclease-related domain